MFITCTKRRFLFIIFSNLNTIIYIFKIQFNKFFALFKKFNVLLIKNNEY